MAGQRRTVEERKILYLLEVAGFTREEINEALKRRGFRPVPRSTYKMNLRNEVPLFKTFPGLLMEFARKPVPYGDWPADWIEAVGHYNS